MPPTLSGTMINLTIDEGQREFYPGLLSTTIGYNGAAYLGPTLVLNAGDSMQFIVQNDLADTTSLHWHGLHVSPGNDGSPHNPIAPGQTWSPSFTVRDKAGTYLYHPHMHGSTMDQVILGAAGFIIVNDPEESVLDLPRTYGVDDIPLVFQFKMIDANGQLMLEDEMDNEVLVNGDIAPVATLPAQVVRLRLLNGSSHRTFRFGIPMVGSFQQIASDGGLLDAPVTLTRLNLSPGERAEVLVDLAGIEGMNFDIMTYGSELPQGVVGGQPPMGMAAGPLDDTDFAVMSVNVVPATPNPVTTVPSALTTNTPWPESSATQTLTVQMQEIPMMSNEWFLNGLKFDITRIDYTTTEGTTVIWEFENMSMMGHPFHVHGGQFYILDIDGALPPMNERGRKDVVLVEPMSTVRAIMKFEDFSDPLVPYMFHCHILSHEDNGMMGQLLVNDIGTGIHDIVDNGDLIIYPNPVDGDHVTIASKEERVERVRLFDGTGRLVLDQRVFRNPVTVPVAQLGSGLYAVEITLTGRMVRTGLLVP